MITPPRTHALNINIYLIACMNQLSRVAKFTQT